MTTENTPSETTEPTQGKETENGTAVLECPVHLSAPAPAFMSHIFDNLQKDLTRIGEAARNPAKLLADAQGTVEKIFHNNLVPHGLPAGEKKKFWANIRKAHRAVALARTIIASAKIDFLVSELGDTEETTTSEGEDE